VPPEQVVDVMALMGDTIDNIKGVPGIGEKGAKELIGKYGSVENLIAHASELTPKRRETLLANVDAARQSRELATIHTSVPVDFVPDNLRFGGTARDRCFKIFSELGFTTLSREFAPTAGSVTKDYRIVNTSDDLRALVDRLESAGTFAFRVLVDRPSAMQASIVGFAFSTKPRDADYVPVGHRALGGIPSMAQDEALEILGPLFANPAITKFGHDLKFDAIVLGRHEIALGGLGTDTMLASYLLDATRNAHKLEDLSLEHTAYRALAEEDICGKGVKAMSLAEVPVEAAVDYAGERADLVGQLAPLLSEQMKKEQLTGVYDTLELPLIPVLVDVERAGIRVDVHALLAQSQKVEQELSRLMKQVHDLAGGEFNIGSPKQLAEVLFDRLSLPVLKRTGTSKAPSTAVEVLEELALTHELPRLILEWRGMSKLKGTYIDALPQLVNTKTGRVHTSFNQAVAATGRLSSSDPNLQNIPIRTELGREIRRAFIADPGHVLISADYSQIELRVLAHLSGDETLIEAFQRGDDIHDQTAEKVFGGTGMDKHRRRSIAKMINYALLYGKTAFTLSKDIGVTPQIAQEFINSYFSGFPRVREFLDRTLDEARASGVVKTMYGRRRRVPEINSRNFQDRGRAERETLNMPIQGTAADIMKRAMIDTHARLRDRPTARMILTVHDELLFEVPKHEADELAAFVRDSMQSAAQLLVPLTVDVGIGENWKEAKG
jgi:DNA polymerase-1